MYKWLIVFIASVIPGYAWCTVTNQSFSVSYTCTGTTGPYAFTFPISDPTALTVTQNGTALTNPANYTTTPVNNNYTNGGSVTLVSSCPNTQTIVLTRTTPLTQATSFYENMPSPMKAFERSLDKLTEIAQEFSRPGCKSDGANGFSCIGNVAGSSVTSSNPLCTSGNPYLLFNGSCASGGFNGISYLPLSGGTVNGPIKVASINGVVMADSFTSISSAIAALPSGGTLQVNSFIPVTTNTTIPSNITVNALAGGGFTQTGSFTLNFNGPFNGPLGTVFNGFTAGQIKFNSGAIDMPPVYAGWWQNYQSNAGPALNSAIASLQGFSGTIQLPCYGAILTSPVNATGLNFFGGEYTIQGCGTGTSILYESGGTNVGFDLTGSQHFIFKDFQVNANNSGACPLSAFLMARNNTNASAGIHTLSNITTTGCFRTSVLYDYGSEEINVENVDLENTYAAGGNAVVWITSDNAGTGEGMTSSYATISTGGQSTTDIRFTGKNKFVNSGAGSDLIHLRGSVGSISMSNAELYLTAASPRSYFFIDMPNGANLYNFSVTHSRADNGLTPSYFLELFNSGTGTGTNWTFEDNSYDVQTHSVFATGTNSITGFRWKNNTPSTAESPIFGTLSASDIETYKSGAITFNGNMTNGNRIYYNSSSNPITVTGTNDGTNFLLDRNTGQNNATYKTGTWTPSPTNLTVVGTPTYSGTYTRNGNVVFITLNVSATTSTTSTANSTNFSGLPYTVAASNVCYASTTNANNLGTGFVYINPNNVIYTPAWSALPAVFISCTYTTNAPI